MAAPSLTEKMNDIWRSGYCQTVVEHGRETDIHRPSPEGSMARIAHLKKHIGTGLDDPKGCKTCWYATVMKHCEGLVAARLGPEVHRGFLDGDSDVIKHPDFNQSHVQLVFRELAKLGYMTQDFMNWVNQMTQRRDYFEDTGAAKPQEEPDGETDGETDGECDE